MNQEKHSRGIGAAVVELYLMVRDPDGAATHSVGRLNTREARRVLGTALRFLLRPVLYPALLGRFLHAFRPAAISCASWLQPSPTAHIYFFAAAYLLR